MFWRQVSTKQNNWELFSWKLFIEIWGLRLYTSILLTHSLLLLKLFCLWCYYVLSRYIKYDRYDIQFNSLGSLIHQYLWSKPSSQAVYRPIHLYLIFEKSSWKNPVRRTGFLVYFELDFYCLCSLQKSILKLIFPTWSSTDG